MQTWSQIIDYFVNLNSTYPSEQHRQMLKLVRHLSNEPDMMMVNRSVDMGSQELLLWVPPSARIVHVQAADRDGRGFVMYLDNAREGDFDGEKHHAEMNTALTTITQLIRHSLT
jgi:hypothetical protein